MNPSFSKRKSTTPLRRSPSVSSITSTISNATIIRTKPLTPSRLTQVDWIDELQSKSSWFKIYSNLTCGRIQLESSHFYDFLKIICDVDAINDVISCHILSLIEQRSELLSSDEELLEQILGTLLNSINVQPCSRSFNFQRRVLLTCSNLFLTFNQLTMDSSPINCLFKSTIKRLLREVTRKSNLASASKECLSALIEVFPNSFALKSSETNQYILPEYELLEELTTSQESLLIGHYCDNNPEMLNHCLNILMKDEADAQTRTIWSPSIFKQFLRRFLLSSHLYQVHFLILLFKRYHILFTTAEERSLFHQLAILSKHPSLGIFQRLFILEFIYNMLDQTEVAQFLDHVHFLPIESDGPDTLEKKLCILSKMSISDDQLLKQLQHLLNLSLREKSNLRSTKSLYRVMSHILSCTQRNILHQIEAIVIGLMNASPKNHVTSCITLFTTYRQLAEAVCSSMVVKITSEHITYHEDYTLHMSALFTLIQWILTHSLVPDRVSLYSLLQFLEKTTIQTPGLIPRLLSCIESTIKFNSVTDDERNLIRRMLAFIASHEIGKSDVTLSSWAQLFTIALNSPCDTAGLQSVLSTDSLELAKLSNINLEDVVTMIDAGECVIQVERLPHVVVASVDDDVSSSIQINYSLSLSPETEESLFAVTVDVTAASQSHRSKCHYSRLKKGKRYDLTVSVKLVNEFPFEVTLSCNYSDKSGRIYSCDNLFNQVIPFCEMLSRSSSVKCTQSFAYTWNAMKERDMANNCLLESVILVDTCASVADLFLKYKWLNEFTVADGYCSPTSELTCDRCSMDSSSATSLNCSFGSPAALTDDSTLSDRSEIFPPTRHYLAMKVLSNDLILVKVHSMKEFVINLHLITFNHKVALLLERSLID